MKNLLLIFLILSFCSCTVSKNFKANKKYAASELVKDYEVFQNILEESHPGLYWYTSKDSMDLFFQRGRSFIKDSLTETGFRNILSYVTSKINCGHTTVRASKQMSKLLTTSSRVFPLGLKIWGDTAVVTSNLSRKDSQVYRGVLLQSIDGIPINLIVDSLFKYLSADGYNLTHKYQTLSNRTVFGSLYASVYGIKPKYGIEYIDTLGQKKKTEVSIYIATPDTTKKTAIQKISIPNRRELRKRRLQANRFLHYDTALPVAIMDLNTFSKGSRLQQFFRSSFRELRKNGTKYLIIDLRGNGGGSVTNSNLLTRYLAEKPFKVADSLYAITRKSKYGGYQSGRLANWLFLVLFTKKGSDGNLHFRYFEKRHFAPKKNNHYNGSVYILTGGNTFSAASLVTQALKDQKNVIVVGEETGGGSYGNNAWLIPEVTLPNTKLRFRLPLFRLVIDQAAPKTGRGIIPEVESLPTVEDIRRSRDFKMEKTMRLIKEASAGNY